MGFFDPLAFLSKNFLSCLFSPSGDVKYWQTVSSIKAVFFLSRYSFMPPHCVHPLSSSWWCAVGVATYPTGPTLRDFTKPWDPTSTSELRLLGSVPLWLFLRGESVHLWSSECREDRNVTARVKSPSAEMKTLPALVFLVLREPILSSKRWKRQSQLHLDERLFFCLF